MASTDKATTPPPPSAQPTSDTPISAKISGKAPFKTDEFERRERFRDFAKEMVGKFVGPVDPKEFLDTHLGKEAFVNKSVPTSPWNDALKEKFRRVHSSRIVDGKLKFEPELQMYKPLVEAINDCIDNVSFEYAKTDAHKDCRKLAKAPDTAPDAVLYDRVRSKLRNSKSDSAFSDSVIEVKGPEYAKAFKDTPGGLLESPAEEAKVIRGQLVAYAVAQFLHQFRTHLFMVYVHSDKARLIRWDHAGAIVTAEFSYSEQDYLADFYSRYTRATPEARGIDTTVRRLEDDAAMATEVRAQLKLDNTTPVFEFQVWNDPHDDETKPQPKPEPLPYYGTLPFTGEDQSVTGRATRAFKVWDPRSKVIVLLKDTWRVDSQSIDCEGRVYATLEAYKVRNVPKCLRSGDVNPGAVHHRTHTQDYATGSRGHVHYRLLLREVCRGKVTDFKDTKELVTVIRDSLIAHQDAYEKAGLLHRDVSAGNILITENGTGLLADWELAKSTSELDKARQPERTGTWQFISAALLSANATYSKLEDDLESHFHVLGWTALQYTKHSRSGEIVADYLHSVYDKTYSENGKVMGDTGKIDKMLTSALAKFGFEPGPLADLITDLEKTCAARYADEPDLEAVDIVLKALSNEAFSPKERKVYMDNPDYRIHELRKRLLSETWFIDRFNEALESDKWSKEALERREIELPRTRHQSVPKRSSNEEGPSSDKGGKRRKTQQTGPSQQDRLGAVAEGH